MEDIKDILKLFNNTHIFDLNILEKLFFIHSRWYGGGTQLSFWYRCAAQMATNGGLKNG